MFKEYTSRLGIQIRPVSGGTIDDYTGTQFDYACRESTNVPVERKRVLFPERYVHALVQLFKESIDPNTFEHMVAVGEDVGLGLFSFANVKKDPNSGLYLVYRESIQPFIGPLPEFYLGAFQNPGDYDKIFQKGVEDTISVDKGGFKVKKSKDRYTKTIEDLETEVEKLQLQSL